MDPNLEWRREFEHTNAECAGSSSLSGGRNFIWFGFSLPQAGLKLRATSSIAPPKHPLTICNLLLDQDVSSASLTSSQAALKLRAASSMAPPKRGPIVSSPLTRQDTRSLPARDVTMVLCAPAVGVYNGIRLSKVQKSGCQDR